MGRTLLIIGLLSLGLAAAQANFRFDDRSFSEAELEAVMVALCAGRVAPKEQTCVARPAVYDGPVALYRVLEGSFSAANRRELVVQVTYDPPDNRFGGVALFARTPAGLRLMHYTDQAYASNCLKYRSGGRDALLCYGGGFGQGYTVENLRQVRVTALRTEETWLLNVSDNEATCLEDYKGVKFTALERRNLSLIVRLEERRGRNNADCDLEPKTLPAARHTLTFTLHDGVFRPDAASARIIAALSR